MNKPDEMSREDRIQVIKDHIENYEKTGNVDSIMAIETQLWLIRWYFHRPPAGTLTAPVEG